MANKFREKPVEEKPMPQRQPQKPVVETPQEPVPEQPAEPVATAKEKVKLGKTERTLSKVLAGDMLAKDFAIRQIPLVLLCVGCFMLMVANRYNVEKIIKDRKQTEETIARLREKRIEMQVQYQQAVRISNIADMLQGSEVGITAGPPFEIEK